MKLPRVVALLMSLPLIGIVFTAPPWWYITTARCGKGIYISVARSAYYINMLLWRSILTKATRLDKEYNYTISVARSSEYTIMLVKHNILTKATHLAKEFNYSISVARSTDYTNMFVRHNNLNTATCFANKIQLFYKCNSISRLHQ